MKDRKLEPDARLIRAKILLVEALREYGISYSDIFKRIDSIETGYDADQEPCKNKQR